MNNIGIFLIFYESITSQSFVYEKIPTCYARISGRIHSAAVPLFVEYDDEMILTEFRDPAFEDFF